MNESIRVAGHFLKQYGCTNIRAKSDNEIFGVVAADYKERKLNMRVQLKPEWGMDIPTNCGTNWADARYPYGSVQLILPPPEAGPDESTHYLLIACDLKRVFFCPRTVVDEANRGWLNLDKDEMKRYGVGVSSVSTAIVPNWTPRAVFFSRSTLADIEWKKDPHNVWEQPKVVPMNVDEFLASL